MGLAGERCPEIANALETPEGIHVAAVLDRWGVWRRAGMSGAIVGLDMSEALTGLDAACDRALACRLLIVAEAAFCAATMKAAGAKGGAS